MKANDTIPPMVMNMDMLEELIKKENPDEMGLLDLIFMEEILNQKMRDRAA